MLQALSSEQSNQVLWETLTAAAGSAGGANLALPALSSITIPREVDRASGSPRAKPFSRLSRRVMKRKSGSGAIIRTAGTGQSGGVGHTSEEAVTDTDAEDGAPALATGAAGQEDRVPTSSGQSLITSSVAGQSSSEDGVKIRSAGGAMPEGLLTFALGPSVTGAAETQIRGHLHEGTSEKQGSGDGEQKEFQAGEAPPAVAALDSREQASQQQQQERQLSAKTAKRKKKGCFSWCFAPRGSISDEDALAAAAPPPATGGPPPAAAQQLKGGTVGLQSVDGSLALKTTGILLFSDGGDAAAESLISVGYVGGCALRGPAQEPLFGQMAGSQLMGKAMVLAGMGKGLEGMGMKLGALNSAGISALSIEGQGALQVKTGRGRSSTNDGDNGPGTPTLGTSSQVRKLES